MTGRRLVTLCVLTALLIGSWVLVSFSEVKYRVDFTSVVELWGDVLRDADRIGLSMTRVSDNKEAELGSELAKRFEPLIVPDPQLQGYVSEVGQRLLGQARRKTLNYQFHAIRGLGINAFSLPGGNIYITQQMLGFAKSEAELAAILAHEISHVDLRHCIERFQYELLARRIMPSDVAAIARLPYGLFVTAYSEQEEAEADADAIIMMAKAGYHPKHGLALYDRMSVLETQARRRNPPTGPAEELGAAVWEALKEYFRTHPSWPDRTRKLAGVLQRNESRWADQRFYVGRSNLSERTSWTTRPIDDELKPYGEPPALSDYLSKDRYPDFKAMAVHLSSGLSAVASSEESPSSAIARAVSGCEMKIKPCQLYALGDAVVFDLSKNEIDVIASSYARESRIERGPLR